MGSRRIILRFAFAIGQAVLASFAFHAGDRILPILAGLMAVAYTAAGFDLMLGSSRFFKRFDREISTDS